MKTNCKTNNKNYFHTPNLSKINVLIDPRWENPLQRPSFEFLTPHAIAVVDTFNDPPTVLSVGHVYGNNFSNFDNYFKTGRAFRKGL